MAGKYNLKLDGLVQEMLDQKDNHMANLHDRSIMYDKGNLNERKRDYLRGVYESDVRFMGRNLIDERECVRGLPMSQHLINEGEIGRFQTHLKNRIAHMDEMLKQWTQSQKELFTTSLDHFRKNALHSNKQADKNLKDFERDMEDNKLLKDYVDLGQRC